MSSAPVNYRPLRRYDVSRVLDAHHHLFPFACDENEIRSAVQLNSFGYYCWGAFEMQTGSEELAGFVIASIAPLASVLELGNQPQDAAAAQGRTGDDDPVLYICLLGVADEYRRQGVASRLLEGAKQLAANYGISRLLLHSMTGNHNAEAFYAHHRFTPVHLVPAFYQLKPSAGEEAGTPTLDAMLMECDLSAAGVAEARASEGTAAEDSAPLVGSSTSSFMAAAAALGTSMPKPAAASVATQAMAAVAGRLAEAWPVDQRSSGEPDTSGASSSSGGIGGGGDAAVVATAQWWPACSEEEVVELLSMPQPPATEAEFLTWKEDFERGQQVLGTGDEGNAASTSGRDLPFPGAGGLPALAAGLARLFRVQAMGCVPHAVERGGLGVGSASTRGRRPVLWPRQLGTLSVAAAPLEQLSAVGYRSGLVLPLQHRHGKPAAVGGLGGRSGAIHRWQFAATPGQGRIRMSL